MARRSRDPQAARILAAVDSESRPYTDPRATYPRAVEHRAQRGSTDDQRQRR